MKNQNKMRYSLLILKRDQEHIEALETEDFDEAFKLWEKLTDQWEMCAHEHKAFKLSSPVVTAFDPNLIFEVTIRPLVDNNNSSSNNPYQNKMQKEGFSGMFRGDLLDGGYK